MIPDGWTEMPLRAVIKLASGESRPKDIRERPSGEHTSPVYGGNGVLGYSSVHNSVADDIIIGRVGEYCGITRFVGGPKWVTDNALFAKSVVHNVSREFLALRLQHFDVSKLRSKGGQPLVSQEPIYAQCFTFPPIFEQKSIVSIISTWDRAIETVEALIANARAQKKALMQSLLTGKLRLPDFTGEWIETTLDKIAKVTMGSSPPSTSYNEMGEGLPLIQGNADVKSRVSAPRIHTSLITQRCLPDDILFSVRAPVGEIAISLHHACIGRGIAAIQARSKNDAAFLYYVLLFAEPGWATLSQGSTFQAVNSKDLKGFTFRAPTNETERQQIGHVVGEAQRAESVLRDQLAALRQEKSALMQQLLTGKRRVKVDEREDA